MTTRGRDPKQRAKTVAWNTPPSWIEALGGWESFDLDPCAPIGATQWGIGRAFRTAQWHYCEADDGLNLTWWGRVWLNPPFSVPIIGQWLKTLADHGRGIALVPNSTETQHFFGQVWHRAHGVLFVKARPHFFDDAGEMASYNCGFGIALAAYGEEDADLLSVRPIDGQFIPLRLPRWFAAAVLMPTWRELVADIMQRAGGAATVADLYREAATHPKIKQNPHWREKIRQTLQRGPFRNVGAGQWVLAA